MKCGTMRCNGNCKESDYCMSCDAQSGRIEMDAREPAERMASMATLNDMDWNENYSERI